MEQKQQKQNLKKQKFTCLLNVYCKDNPSWLKQALDSVLSNTCRPSEVLIMIDGPIGQELRTIINDYSTHPLVRVLSHPVNIGRGAALAYAVPKCSYDLIALMDADDVCRPNRFEKELAAFATDVDLSVCGAQIQEVDAETFEPLAKRQVPLSHTEICKYLKTRMPFNNQTIMFKKKAVLDSGNFKAFGLLEDYYMWARVIAKGFKTINLPDILVDMRVNQAMYGRRGGWNYFHMNRVLFKEMRALGLLSFWEYYYTLSVRFFVQVLMPNKVRKKLQRKY